MRTKVFFSVIFAAILIAGTAGAVAGDTGFTAIVNHYEAVRETLIDSSTDGIEAEARAIAIEVDRLAADFSAARAGVGADSSSAVEALLPEIRQKAEELAASTTIDEARQALAELTRPLTRWQKLVQGPRPIVVYCPMEKKAWLQPDEPVGNPYDPSMLRCGEVVQR